MTRRRWATAIVMSLSVLGIVWRLLESPRQLDAQHFRTETEDRRSELLLGLAASVDSLDDRSAEAVLSALSLPATRAAAIWALRRCQVGKRGETELLAIVDDTEASLLDRGSAAIGVTVISQRAPEVLAKIRAQRQSAGPVLRLFFDYALSQR